MANPVRTMFANMSWLLVGQVFTSICAFIWTILTARYLGVSCNGIFGFAVSITSLFSVFSDFGISTHIVRSIAADNSIVDKYLGNAISLKLLLSILYTVTIFIALLILHSTFFTIFVTMLFTLEMVFKNINGLLYGAFQAYENAKFQSISNILTNGLSFIFIVIAIILDKGLVGIAVAYIIANFIALVYSVIVLREHIIKPKLQFDLSFNKKLIIAGIPFALTSLFYTIYYQIDIVMLNKIVGNYATGMYNATYKLINLLTLFYSIYSALVFPIMSKLYTSKKELLKFSFEKSIKYLLLVTIPLAFAMSIYATNIITFIYGNQYADADSILQVLIWTVVFLFVNGACSTLLNASHQEISVTKIYCLAAIFNIILNFLFIPRYYYIGASVATVLSDIFIFLLCLYSLKRIDHMPSKHLGFDVLKIILASIIFTFILIMLNLNMWLAIPIGITVYLIAILITKVLDEDDKNIIHQLIGR